ncbi:prolipoprotein diacylglyceryl transferase [Nocardiopsis baichengensis]|uniref:hypothetical protein n=1 Tax=Nocardiopsis baichengensis TaxID=280240 RepID=UPI000346CD45|nr:hypothetical protein [Nocardiopsis baichengensis]
MDPVERAEAALLGQILLDEEARADGEGAGPRLLEQVREWGITSSSLFRKGYHQEVWKRLQDTASSGHATRSAVAERLRADTAPAEEAGDDTRVRPELANPARLWGLTDAAEGARPDRSAVLVVDAAMHWSAGDMADELRTAAHTDEPGATAEAAEKARGKLARMRQAWERLPAGARTAVEAVKERPKTPLVKAQEQLDEARELMATLRTDPAHAAERITSPAWGIIDRLAGAVDALANASIDAPRSPETPNGRTFLKPGEMLPDQGGQWAEHRQEQDRQQAEQDRSDDARLRRSRAAEQAPAPEPEADPERAARERRLLGSLMAAPEQLDQVDVDPATVRDPQVRRALEVVGDLRERGVDIDGQVVDAAMQARGGPPLGEVAAEPVTPTDATTGGLAARVSRDAAADRVHQAVAGLQAAGDDSGAAAPDLIAAAEAALDRLGPEPPQLVEHLEPLAEPERDDDPEKEAEGAPAAGPSAERTADAPAEPERGRETEPTAPADGPEQPTAPAPRREEAPEQRLDRLEQEHLAQRRAAESPGPEPKPAPAAPEPVQIEH